MSSGDEGQKLRVVGSFDVATARELAHGVKPRRPPRPGFQWVLREWTETEGGEMTAFAQWVEEPVA